LPARHVQNPVPDGVFVLPDTLVGVASAAPSIRNEPEQVRAYRGTQRRVGGQAANKRNDSARLLPVA
jgi:hypothetical protein